MKIKFGDIEYFELLSFRDKLKSRHLDKFDLTHLDALRFEVETKIEVINNLEKLRRNETNRGRK